MPFPPERRTIVIEHEAARRRFLTLCERCFPEWTKQLTSARIVELTRYFLEEMPNQVRWLQRIDGLKMGGYPAAAFGSQPIVEAGQSLEAPPETAPQDGKAGRFSLVAIDRMSRIPQILVEAETQWVASLWLPRLMDGRRAALCRFCATVEDAKWIINALERPHP